MLKKLSNESIAILSAVASGLVVDALYPSIADLITIVFSFCVNDKNENLIDLWATLLRMLTVFFLFLFLWKFCTFFLPSFIRFYEKRKKIRYIPKTPSEQITLFYKVFVETARLEKSCSVTCDKVYPFYITLNKTLDLCHRLILATAYQKPSAVMNRSIFRTKNRNQNFLNYRKYINIYDYIATIDSLLIILETAEKLYHQFNLNSQLILKDINDATENLSSLKEQAIREE